MILRNSCSFLYVLFSYFLPALVEVDFSILPTSRIPRPSSTVITALALAPKAKKAPADYWHTKSYIHKVNSTVARNNFASSIITCEQLREWFKQHTHSKGPNVNSN